MRRILLVIIIWIVFLGGLTWYMQTRDHRLSAPGITMVNPQQAQQNYQLRIDTSFKPEQDPFAVNLDKTTHVIKAVINGKPLQIPVDTDLYGALTIDPLPHLVIGDNELFVQASPPLTDDSQQAMRIRISQGEKTIAEKTFWAQAGANVSGRLTFDLKPALESDDHD